MWLSPSFDATHDELGGEREVLANDLGVSSSNHNGLTVFTASSIRYVEHERLIVS